MWELQQQRPRCLITKRDEHHISTFCLPWLLHIFDTLIASVDSCNDSVPSHWKKLHFITSFHLIFSVFVWTSEEICKQDELIPLVMYQSIGFRNFLVIFPMLTGWSALFCLKQVRLQQVELSHPTADFCTCVKKNTISRLEIFGWRFLQRLLP